MISGNTCVDPPRWCVVTRMHVIGVAVCCSCLQGHEVGGASPQLTVFHGLRAPPISVEAYLVRIAKYAKCSPACFAHSMVHMLKLAQQDPSFAPTRLNVHRLVLTGVLISAKFLDDRYFNNAFYAKVCCCCNALRFLGLHLRMPCGLLAGSVLRVLFGWLVALSLTSVLGRQAPNSHA